MSTSREACSGWGGVELSFLGATFHVSTHAPSTCTDIPTPRAGPGQLPRVRGRTPGLPPRGRRAAFTSSTSSAPAEAHRRGSDKRRSVDFPRWLIGGATSGRVRHVPAGAPKAGYFAAFFLRSAQ